MKSCLMVMNARDIPECLLAIRALPIDKAWFRGFTETGLEPEIAKFVASTDYERYILLSDDTVPTEFALRNLLKVQDAGPVVTGWCNIFPGKPASSVELRPIENERTSVYLEVRDRIPRSWVPVIKKLYKVPFLGEILEAPIYAHFPDLETVWAQAPVFRTYFVNWCLTSMSRDIWQRFPFQYHATRFAGHGSDQSESLRLAEAGVGMLCARDSFVYHIHSLRNFVVGKVKPEVVFERWEEERIRA